MQLKQLTYQDRSTLTGYFKKYPPDISEFTFTNLYVWLSTRPISWMLHDDTLCIFISSSDKTILFGPPVGPASLSTVIASHAFPVDIIERFPESLSDDLCRYGYSLLPDPDNWDYVFLVNDLAKLKGRRYAKKRNHIKHCLTEYNCTYEAIDQNNIAECQEMQNRWCKHRSCTTHPGLCGEYQATQKMFAKFHDLELIGGAIRVNGRIEAYSIGEQLTPDTAVCHFEKAMPQFHGLSQLIVHWYAKEALSYFTYVNREQDLGISGLKKAKQSYFPHHMVKKIRAVKEKAEGVIPSANQRCG